MLRFLVLASLAVAQGATAEEVGTVISATPLCAVIDGPRNVALVTGKLTLRKGDLVSGDFSFHSYGTLRDSTGAVAGVSVFVEETTTNLSQLPRVIDKLRGKC